MGKNTDEIDYSIGWFILMLIFILNFSYYFIMLFSSLFALVSVTSLRTG